MSGYIEDKFWALTVFPMKKYSQLVSETFRVSMASFGPEIKSTARSSIIVQIDDQSFVLCSLTPGKIEQQPLSHVFVKGENVVFYTNGENEIHLTGNYLISYADMEEDDGITLSDEDSETDEDDTDYDDYSSSQSMSDIDEDEDDDYYSSRKRKEPKIVEITEEQEASIKSTSDQCQQNHTKSPKNKKNGIVAGEKIDLKNSDDFSEGSDSEIDDLSSNYSELSDSSDNEEDLLIKDHVKRLAPQKNSTNDASLSSKKQKVDASPKPNTPKADIKENQVPLNNQKKAATPKSNPPMTNSQTPSKPNAPAVQKTATPLASVDKSQLPPKDKIQTPQKNNPQPAQTPKKNNPQGPQTPQKNTSQIAQTPQKSNPQSSQINSSQNALKDKAPTPQKQNNQMSTKSNLSKEVTTPVVNKDMGTSSVANVSSTPNNPKKNDLKAKNQQTPQSSSNSINQQNTSSADVSSNAVSDSSEKPAVNKKGNAKNLSKASTPSTPNVQNSNNPLGEQQEKVIPVPSVSNVAEFQASSNSPVTISNKRNKKQAGTPTPSGTPLKNDVIMEEEKKPQTPKPGPKTTETSKNVVKQSTPSIASETQPNTSALPPKDTSIANPNQKKKEALKANSNAAATPKKENKVTTSGVEIEEIASGEGKKAKKGSKVAVVYKGMLSNGKVFDSNTAKNPLKFKLGDGSFIKGFDIGVEGMAVNSTRKVKIPASLGFGEEKLPGIPPNSDLTFEITLVQLN